MHPLVRIICLVAFALALQLVRWSILMGIGVLLLPMMAWRGASVFRVMIRRTRWLLLSILVIYAYATPGEYLQGLPDAIAPTYEGLQASLVQMGRLLAMLAALSVLLASTGREDLMVGIYLLLRPFRLLGLAPERFAARLWLTLHYVESMPDGVIHRLRQYGWRLDDALREQGGQPQVVQMRFLRLRLLDVLVLMSLPPLFWLLA